MNAAAGRKRRATRACCHCRGRKVRCDVMEYGSPCTNCQLDRVDCVTLERRRKRTADEIKRCEQSNSSEMRRDSKLRILAKGTDNESSESEGASLILAREHEMEFILPQYTRSLPAHLNQDDIGFLAKKGALCVPATCLRNKLLTSYAHHVHSDMPLLDLDSFIRPIVQNDKDHPVSLLLLQAVLLAAAAFVDIEDLQAAGFESRIQARATFFQRARLLYDFDYEEDRLTLAQSLLLMSYWEDAPSGLKDGWHWLGLSLSVAQTIGLHRKTHSMDESATRIRIRLWWCIYARDCLMALDMRHSMHISNIEFDTRPLTIDHFELVLSEPTVNSIGYSGLLGNAEHQRSLAVIFIEKVRLCRCLKHVMETQYSVVVDPVPTVVPIRATGRNNQIFECEQDLQNWVLSLAPEAGYTPVDSVQITKAEGLLHVQRSSLRMIYMCLLGALYRPHIHPSSSKIPEKREVSIRQLISAAEQITNLAQDLSTLDLVKFLPATAVTALYSAGIAHLLGVRSDDSQGVNLHRLNESLFTLMILRGIYPTAWLAASFLESAAGRILKYCPGQSIPLVSWQNCTNTVEHQEVPVTLDQCSCPSYARSASDMTDVADVADSPFSGVSPESVSSGEFRNNHDNFMVIDIESELTLGHMMNLASSSLVLNKDQTWRTDV